MNAGAQRRWRTEGLGNIAQAHPVSPMLGTGFGVFEGSSFLVRGKDYRACSRQGLMGLPLALPLARLILRFLTPRR